MQPALPHLLARLIQFPHQAFAQHVAQLLEAPIFDQMRQAAFGARLARPVVAEDAHQFSGRLGGFGRLHKHVQRLRDSEPAGAHLAAGQNVESGPRSPARRNQRDILRLVVGTIRHASRHRNVELSGEIGELRVGLRLRT